MATGVHTSVEGVKAVCSKLEVSPSKSSASSPVHGKGHTPSAGARGHASKTHSGKRGTKETPQKLGSAHAKRGH
jgi:hypothetical protein